MKSETRFRVNKVVPFLKKLRCYYDGIQQKGKSGSPDFYLCIRGKFVALEIKSEEGEPTPLQERKLDEVRVNGKGIGLVAWPQNWDEIKDKLNKLNKGEEI